MGGYLAGADYITIATAGNAANFGDLAQLAEYYYSISDSHGGLQS